MTRRALDVRRGPFLILRIDHVLVPSVLSYLVTDDDGTAEPARLSPFREAATRYPTQSAALPTFHLMADAMPRYEWRIVTLGGLVIRSNRPTEPTTPNPATQRRKEP